jgi:hypothetical protein
VWGREAAQRRAGEVGGRGWDHGAGRGAGSARRGP